MLLLVLGLALAPNAANAAVMSGRSVVAPAPGQLIAFKNVGGQMYEREFLNGAWSTWSNFGGWIKGTPQAVSWGENHADVYVRWGDDSVYHRWWDGTSWSQWERVGLYQVSSDIAPISWGYGRIDLFARGLDGALVHDYFDGSQWQPWEWMGGGIIGTPSAVSWYGGHLDVFVHGTDDKLYHQWYTPGTGWSGFGRIGDWQMSSDPIAGTAGSGHVDVFARGLDGALIHVWFNGSDWQGWTTLGGGIVGNPSVVSWGVNHMDVFVRGTDNALWHRWYGSSGWSGWGSLGGGTVASPVAVSWGYGHIDVYVDGTDGQPWHKWFGNSDWQPWEAMGYPTSAPPASDYNAGGVDIAEPADEQTDLVEDPSGRTPTSPKQYRVATPSGGPVPLRNKYQSLIIGYAKSSSPPGTPADQKVLGDVFQENYRTGNGYSGGYVEGNFAGCAWITIGVRPTSGISTGDVHCQSNGGILAPTRFASLINADKDNTATTLPTIAGKSLSGWRNVRPWVAGSKPYDPVTWTATKMVGWRYVTADSKYVLLSDPALSPGKGGAADAFVLKSTLKDLGLNNLCGPGEKPHHPTSANHADWPNVCH